MISVGSKVRFNGEKHFWKVRAKDDRFLICTWRHFYTICDLVKGIRGKDNYIDAYYDYINCEDIDYKEALYRLNMVEAKPLNELRDLPEDIKKRQLEIINSLGKVPEEQQWLENLEISYRNYVPLIIEEIK